MGDPQTENPTGQDDPLTITIVGDATAGKRCLLFSYVHSTCYLRYEVTIFENFTKKVDVDGKPVVLNLALPGSREEDENFRAMCYAKTDCVLLCFSVGDKNSFENIETQWIHEIRKYCPKGAVVLVALQSDRRSDLDPGLFITTEQAQKLKAKIKADKLVECSVKAQENLALVFEEAVRATLKRKKREARTCKLL